MYLINQNIANEIARSQQMSTDLMQAWFEADDTDEKELEKKFIEEIILENSDLKVAKAVVAFLPLVLENNAITSYIRETMNYKLRVQLPELMTAKEAGLFAQLEFLMDQKQTKQTTELIEHYQAALSKKSKVV